MGPFIVCYAMPNSRPQNPRLRTKSLSLTWALRRFFDGPGMWSVPILVAAAGMFDLWCTLSAYDNGWLVELNPLAAKFLDRWGPRGLAAYRFACTTCGCVFLSWGLRAYRLRRELAYQPRRMQAVVGGGQLAIVAAHLALVSWWIAWFTV